MARNYKKRSLKEMLHLSLQDPTANTPVQTQGFTTEKNPSPHTIRAVNGLSTVPCVTPTSQSPTLQSPTRMAQNKKKPSKKKSRPALQPPTVNTPGSSSQSFSPSVPTIPTVNGLSSSTWMLAPPTVPYMTPTSQSPTSQSPTSQSPTSQSPTSQSPTPQSHTSQSPEDQLENNGQPPKKKAVRSVTTTRLTENDKKTLGTKIQLEYHDDLKAGYRPHDMKITRVVSDIATIVRHYIPMTAKRFVDLPNEVQARVENNLTTLYKYPEDPESESMLKAWILQKSVEAYRRWRFILRNKFIKQKKIVKPNNYCGTTEEWANLCAVFDSHDEREECRLMKEKRDLNKVKHSAGKKTFLQIAYMHKKLKASAPNIEAYIQTHSKTCPDGVAKVKAALKEMLPGFLAEMQHDPTGGPYKLSLDAQIQIMEKALGTKPGTCVRGMGSIPVRPPRTRGKAVDMSEKISSLMSEQLSVHVQSLEERFKRREEELEKQYKCREQAFREEVMLMLQASKSSSLAPMSDEEASSEDDVEIDGEDDDNDDGEDDDNGDGEDDDNGDNGDGED